MPNDNRKPTRLSCLTMRTRGLRARRNRRPQTLGSAHESAILDKIRTRASARVIIGFASADEPLAEMPITGGFLVDRARRSAIDRLQRGSLSRCVFRIALSGGSKEFLSLRSRSAAMISSASRQADVASIREDRLLRPTLEEESIPLIGADVVFAQCYRGAGQTVAFLDTGVEKSHSFLARRVVAAGLLLRHDTPRRFDPTVPQRGGSGR